MGFFGLKGEKTKRKICLEGVGTEEINLEGSSPEVCKIPIGIYKGEVFNLIFGTEHGSYLVIGEREHFKSLLDPIVINGSLKYAPDEVSFRLYDLENNSALSVYEGSRLPHIKRIGSCIGEKEAVHELNRLCSVVKKREELFKELGARYKTEISNIKGYNELAGKDSDFSKKKRIIVILNGINRILNSPQINEAYAKQLCLLVKDIAKKGAPLGVHLILTTTPSAKRGYDFMLRDIYLGKSCEKIEIGKMGGKRGEKGVDVATVGKGVRGVYLSTFTKIEEYIERVSDSVIFFKESTEKLSKN